MRREINKNNNLFFLQSLFNAITFYNLTFEALSARLSMIYF